MLKCDILDVRHYIHKDYMQYINIAEWLEIKNSLIKYKGKFVKLVPVQSNIPGVVRITKDLKRS